MFNSTSFHLPEKVKSKPVLKKLPVATAALPYTYVPVTAGSPVAVQTATSSPTAPPLLCIVGDAPRPPLAPPERQATYSCTCSQLSPQQLSPPASPPRSTRAMRQKPQSSQNAAAPLPLSNKYQQAADTTPECNLLLSSQEKQRTNGPGTH